jgi:hypothetical protein
MLITNDVIVFRLQMDWLRIVIFGAAAVGLLSCQKQKVQPRAPRLEETRHEIVAQASDKAVIVFVAKRRMWVMTSPVARLKKGKISEAAVTNGVLAPLHKALKQEAATRPRAVTRVVIYAVDEIPRATLATIRHTVKKAAVGRGIILPWRVALRGARKTRPSRRSAPLRGATARRNAHRSVYPIVVKATARGVWLNGQLVGKLMDGRLPLKGDTKGESGFELPRLKRKFGALVKTLPVNRWKMLITVTPGVESAVVQRVLQAAGQVGITKFHLDRRLDTSP